MLTADIEKIHKDKFEYRLKRDATQTGNFEVTLFKSQADASNNMRGTLIHSKKTQKCFPLKKNSEEFMSKLNAAL